MGRRLDAARLPPPATRLIEEVSVGAADLQHDARRGELVKLVEQRGKMMPLSLLGGSVAVIADLLRILPVRPVIERHQGFGGRPAAHEDESTATASDHWMVIDLVDELGSNPTTDCAGSISA